jgi:hypothetical protein
MGGLFSTSSNSILNSILNDIKKTENKIKQLQNELDNRMKKEKENPKRYWSDGFGSNWVYSRINEERKKLKRLKIQYENITGKKYINNRQVNLEQSRINSSTTNIRNPSATNSSTTNIRNPSTTNSSTTNSSITNPSTTNSSTTNPSTTGGKKKSVPKKKSQLKKK